MISWKNSLRIEVIIFILDSITLIGKADIVETVVGVLDEKKKGWEADAEDRKLRNYTETIEVDPIFHSKIIGYKVIDLLFIT